MTRPDSVSSDWHGAVPVHAGAVGNGTVVVPGGQTLLGFSCQETTGAAPATFRLVDGGDANGDPVVHVDLSAGGTRSDWYGPHGLFFRSAVTVNLTAGAVDLTVWVGVG